MRSILSTMAVGLLVAVVAMACSDQFTPTGVENDALTVAGGHKVDVCHLNGASDLVPGTGLKNWKMWDFGQIMEVPESALGGHLAHGDRLFGNNGYGFLTA